MRSNSPGITTQLPTIVPEGLPENSIELDVYHLMDFLKSSTVMYHPINLPTLNPTDSARHPIDRWEDLQDRYFPEGQGWVLRNLTKKEYVSASLFSSIDGCSENIDEPGATHAWGWDFGTLIAIKTSWSDTYCAFVTGLDEHGDWAGDCFDIVVEDILNEGIAQGEDWEDVTLREWEMMVSLCKKNGWEPKNL